MINIFIPRVLYLLFGFFIGILVAIKVCMPDKKLYKIKYQRLNTYITIIEARDKFHAIKKFHKMTKHGVEPTIISFEEL